MAEIEDVKNVAGMETSTRVCIALRTPVDDCVAGQTMPHRMGIVLGKDPVGDIDFGKIAADGKPSLF